MGIAYSVADALKAGVDEGDLITATEVSHNLRAVLEHSWHGDTPLVVTKHGIAMGAFISMEDFLKLKALLDAEKAHKD